MKIFLIGWAESNPELVLAAAELERRGHNIVYWARNEWQVPVDPNLFPRTAFHTYYDASRGIPSKEIPCDRFPYPDETLLRELAPAELLTISMMGKLYSTTAVAERRHMFTRFTRYWLGVLRKFKPDLIFFNTTPHAPIYFVLYALAKHLGIRTSMFDLTWVGDRIVWMDDYREGSRVLSDNYLRLRAGQMNISSLAPDIRAHYERHIDPKADTTPLYTTEGLAAFGFLKIMARKAGHFLAALFKPKVFWTKLRWAYITFPAALKNFSYRFRLNLPRLYRSLQSAPDFNRKFVYVPLHFQPECSTNPIGEIFQDQIFMIQTLSQALPEGWEVYVKEHPYQWLPYGVGFSEDRYRLYYNRLKEIQNVRLLPVETRSIELVNRAQAVATVAGTAGWEAIMRGKAALVFGYPWYHNAPGVIKVKTADDCRRAFDNISNGFVISKNDTLAFLGALDLASIHAYLDDHTKRVSPITPEENMKNFVSAFMEILK